MRRLRSFLITVFFGAALGWAVRGMGNESLKQQRRSALEKAGATEAKMTQLLTKVAEIEQLRQQLTEAETTIKQLESELAQVVPSSTVGQPTVDQLERIAGIGPTFAKRLHDAGICTFADVVNSSPETLREIVQTKPWQKINPEVWIEQAQALVMTE